MQKTELDLEGSTAPSLQQAFRVHVRPFSSGTHLSILRRIKNSEAPSLAVLDGRKPVGIEHIALVKDRVRHFFREVTVHAFTPGIRSSARSHPLQPSFSS